MCVFSFQLSFVCFLYFVAVVVLVAVDANTLIHDYCGWRFSIDVPTSLPTLPGDPLVCVLVLRLFCFAFHLVGFFFSSFAQMVLLY